MHELPDEPGKAKLPRELERIRRIDQDMHEQAAKAAGLSEAQAVAHAAEHMEERAAEEYRAPSDHGALGRRSAAHQREQERVAGMREPGQERSGVVRRTPEAWRPAQIGLPPRERVEKRRGNEPERSEEPSE